MVNFSRRHIGISPSDEQIMLKKIGVSSVEELISLTVPQNIRTKELKSVGKALTEEEYLKHIKELGKKNIILKSLIGLGYYNTHTPSVIHRNIFCNPGWYTAYTPYQAEIAQGRLEALLNFQTMVIDLTGLPVANASLLDEATAAAEAVTMMFANRSREQQKNNVRKVFISHNLFPQVKEVIYSRAEPLQIEVVEGDEFSMPSSTDFFGLVIQYPDVTGAIRDYTELVKKVKSAGVQVAVGTDLLSLCLLVPPGEWGADIAYGNSQRFGVPLGYGGPHAAFFAARDDYKRLMPGRIIGVSIDSRGKKAYRMALQTREQHIKREKATSNICTAQALLAIMAGMYAVWHGPEGLKEIAEEVHRKTVRLKEILQNSGIDVINHGLYFDTIQIKCNASDIIPKAEKAGFNFYAYNNNTVSISLDETITDEDVLSVAKVFLPEVSLSDQKIFNVIKGTAFERKSKFLSHPVFHLYRSETEMMRYIKSLENKDLSLVHSMISLGSCTMKLNSAVEMEPISMPEWNQIHPFVPEHQALGYKELIENLDRYLSSITCFKKMSFQPNSGASGEYAGLLVIRAFHRERGQGHRNVALIPSSAHGTNPASAAMAGMEIVVVKCDENGNIDVADLKAKAEQYKEKLSCLMVTYPSTHGVFEESICEITRIIHENGGLVYMDGANMNAQVG
ncbi:MAG: aminomethyl-transferring glycine dehydrogenase, partial [Bacteroidia bacterium]|nr:aminomethyl-transferring glycine dehydrogenase [Bacteroidia bacterium]